VRFLLLILLPSIIFAQDLDYLDFDIAEIETAPIVLPVDFFPEEDPYEGVVKPTLQHYDEKIDDLVNLDDLSPQYRKKKLKADPDFTAVDKLIPSKKELKLLAKEKEKIPPPEGAPEHFYLYLKKGTRLKDLKFHSTKTIHRDLQVKAVREYPTAPFFKIMDKNGKKRFEVRAQDVKYLNETIDLDPRPKTFDVQTKTPKNRTYDEKENFEHSLSLNGETLEPSYFNVLTGDTATVDASSFKIDYKLYHLWDFPLNFGLILSFEDGSWEDFKWSSMYFGLGLKVPWNIASWISLEGQITWQSTLFFSFKGPTTYDLSNNFVALSGEVVFKTVYGTYFLSALYKKIYWSVIDQPIDVPAEKRDSSAVGFGFGVKFKSIISL